MMEFGKPPDPVYKQALGKGMWIVMGKKWYTPQEHFREFGKGLSLPEDSWRLEYPLKALAEGRALIETMIQESEDKEKILDALRRMNRFTDKILKEMTRKPEY